MASIKLRFVSHPGLFNWACQFAQERFQFTHVEVVLPDRSLLGAMSDGVKIRPRGYDCRKFIAEAFLYVSVTEAQEKEFYEFLRVQVGKKYDFRAIWALFLTSRDWQDPDRWFCAELCAGAFIACGRFKVNPRVPVNRITVRDQWLLASAVAEV